MRYQCDVDGERDLSRRVELGTEVSIKISGTCSYDGLGPSRAVISDIRGIIIFLKQMLASDRDKVNLLSDEDTVINDLNKMIDGTKAFTLILDDPKGVTTIESLSGSHPDGRLKMEVYNHEKGTEVDPSPERGSDDGSPQSHDSTQGFQSFDTKQKCPICNSDDCSSRIMLTTIPHFEEVCIWAILCNECGYKNTSIDPTSEVPDKGRRITLKITHPQDFDRYVLQSKSTRIIIEELGLEATLASNSGQFTTIEGILKTMYDTYRQTIFVNTCQEGSDSNGDSDDEAAKFKDFIERFGKVYIMFSSPKMVSLNSTTLPFITNRLPLWRSFPSLLSLMIQKPVP